MAIFIRQQALKLKPVKHEWQRPLDGQAIRFLTFTSDEKNKSALSGPTEIMCEHVTIKVSFDFPCQMMNMGRFKAASTTSLTLFNSHPCQCIAWTHTQTHKHTHTHTAPPTPSPSFSFYPSHLLSSPLMLSTLPVVQTQ